jgi:predicted RNA-binding protein with PUA-like domain
LLGEIAVAHWLVKSEPDSWSWQQMVAAGKKGTHWNGVRNHVAKQNLMAMALGEQAFFYHSNEGKEIVGIVEVTKLYYPDPSDESGKFGMVDVRAVKAVPKPVTLAAIKAEPKLAKMMLVANSRLSVQPVTDAEWKLVCEMGGL